VTERIYGSKFPSPLPQDHDSLCEGRGRKTEKGNKRTKRKKKIQILSPWFLSLSVFYLRTLKQVSFLSSSSNLRNFINYPHVISVPSFALILPSFQGFALTLLQACL